MVRQDQAGKIHDGSRCAEGRLPRVGEKLAAGLDRQKIRRGDSMKKQVMRLLVAMVLAFCGTHLAVPQPGTAGGTFSSFEAAVPADDVVDIIPLTFDQLKALPGIGGVYAKKII